MSKKTKRIIISSVLTLIFAICVFYVKLPPINLQSKDFWTFLFYCTLFFTGVYFLIKFLGEKKEKTNQDKFATAKKSTIALIALAMFSPIVIMLLGTLISSTMFNAKAYSELIEVPEANFAEDMPEADVVKNIALMDTETAITVGNRVLGDLSDVVSQYEISQNYKQINYNHTPQKVSTLEYANFFKWFSNKEKGIPGYVIVDPVNTAEAKYVEFKEPIKYTESGYFGDDLMRKLRFSYPTKIFGNCSFELDEQGNPYYIVSCMSPKVGIFGALDVSEVIIFNPVDGSSNLCPLSEVPDWVDNVFTGEQASQKYDWYGTLKNGYWNSVFENRDCKVTTDDYGYIIIDDDVWYFTGVTSVTNDESNIGFIISNARTGEYKFYPVTGAEEYSAMESAQGQVQEKGYVASFPSLINVSGEATYIMVLKDNSGLVKLYALVNVKNYSIVATGATQTEAKEAYLAALKQHDIIDKIPEKEDISDENTKEIDIEIAKIQVFTVSGESVFYFTATDGQIYKQSIANDERVIFVKEGDKLKVKYESNDDQSTENAPLVRQIKTFTFINAEEK